MRPIALLAAVLITSSLNAAQAQTPDVSQALRARVEAFEAAWNAHDASAVVALFSEDADQIMGAGPTTRGRQALQQWWRDRFANMAQGRRIALSVSSLRLIAPDVALINTAAESTGGRNAQGQDLPPSNDRGTWVLLRSGGQWLITALRVQPAEQTPTR